MEAEQYIDEAADYDLDEDFEEADADDAELIEALMDSDDDLIEAYWPRRGRTRPRAVRYLRPVRQAGVADHRAHPGAAVYDAQIAALRRQVRAIAAVNLRQSRRIAKLDKTVKLDAALDFARVIKLSDNKVQLDLLPILEGIVKTGLLSESNSLVGNPLAVGIAGLVVNNAAELRQLLARLVETDGPGGGPGGGE